MKRTWYVLLYKFWAIPCWFIPVSWWLDHHESKGWRADVWIWFHSVLYGLNTQITDAEFRTAGGRFCDKLLEVKR